MPSSSRRLHPPCSAGVISTTQEKQGGTSVGTTGGRAPRLASSTVRSTYSVFWRPEGSFTGGLSRVPRAEWGRTERSQLGQTAVENRSFQGSCHSGGSHALEDRSEEWPSRREYQSGRKRGPKATRGFVPEDESPEPTRARTCPSGASRVRARNHGSGFFNLKRRTGCEAVFSCPDPIRGGDNTSSWMAEVLYTDMTPTFSRNTGAALLILGRGRSTRAMRRCSGIEGRSTKVTSREGRPQKAFPGRAPAARRAFYYCGIRRADRGVGGQWTW